MPKTPKDPRFEDRLRAHLRRRMERLGWGPSKVAEATGFDQGYVSNWLLKKRGDRGASAFFIWRVCQEIELDPLEMFRTDPEERFWSIYTPRQGQADSEDPRHASTPPLRTARREVGPEGMPPSRRKVR